MPTVNIPQLFVRISNYLLYLCRSKFFKMISRRYLRIKVMQGLYARSANPNETIADGLKKLEKTIQSCNDLSYYFFSIFPEIKDYVLAKFEECKNKNFPTEEDLHPNTRFVDNLVIRQMEENQALTKKWNALHVNWSTQVELLSQLYTAITELPEYAACMNAPAQSYKADKELVLAIIEKVLAESELLHWFFEEKNLHWFDDYNDALLSVYQNIVFWKASQEQVPVAPLYKDEVEDVKFYKDLFTKTANNGDKYYEIIEKNLRNWEAERIIETDMILMKMALCELLEFPSIPVKVTINEYIEIAKTYGSEKSGTFINGLIDKIANDLRNEGNLNKSGRGLISTGYRE